MHRKLAISWTAIALALGVPQAWAADASTAPSTASRGVSAAGGEIVSGSATALAGSGKLVVASLAVGGETAVLLLRGSATGVEAAIRVSAAALDAASVGVGTVLTLVGETAGYALLAGGQLIAYLPNDATAPLLEPATVRQ
jgi:hypothetical protein